MINPLKPDDRPKMPEMDFPHYTPFMEGRNELEAMLEAKPNDYMDNEFMPERRFKLPFPKKEVNRFEYMEESKDKFYELLSDIYDEVKNKKPEGNYTFYIGSGWSLESMATPDGMEFIVWMRGAWCDSKFLDEPIQSIAENHIPKDMMRGF